MSAVKDFVLPPLVLTIICIVISLALVGTYQTTLPIIQEQERQAARAARVEVLPTADDFAEVPFGDEKPAGIIDAYEATNGAGYVITGFAKGYGGEMQVTVGIGADGNITGVKLLKHNETQGLGSKTGLPSHTGQYVGKDAALEGIDFIGGSTVSSRAMHEAVGAAYQAYAQITGAELAAPAARAPVDDAVKNALFFDVELADFAKLPADGEIYKAGEEGYLAVVSAKGFIGDIVSAVAFQGDGSIRQVLILENPESEGYGLGLSQPAYLESLAGVRSPQEVELIAGATVSSNGFVQSIEAAFDLLEQAAGIAPVSAGMPEDFMTEAVWSEFYPDAEDYVRLDGDAEIYRLAEEYMAVTGGASTDFSLAVWFTEEGTLQKVDILSDNREGDTEPVSGDVLELFAGVQSVNELDAIGGEDPAIESIKTIVQAAFEAHQTAIQNAAGAAE